MSGGLEQIREGLTAHLNGKGIRAVSAWSGTARTFPCGPVAAVSLRGAAGARPAFKTIWGSDMTRRRGAGRSCMGAG